MKEGFRELMLSLIAELYESEIEYDERQWDDDASRMYLVLYGWEQPEDALCQLLARVRELDKEAIRKLLYVFGDPECGYARAELLSVSKRGGEVIIRADCPWLDLHDEAHYREGDIVLSGDDRLIFPSGGQIVLSEFFLQPAAEECGPAGMTVSYIGR